MFLALTFASRVWMVRRSCSSFVILSRIDCSCTRSDVRRSAVCAISSYARVGRVAVGKGGQGV
jgi:hypothetical protein